MLSLKLFFRQQKYFASALLFACFSLIFSTWITYIPYIADKVGITEGKIGGAIFFASLGSFVVIPFANRLVKTIGVGKLTYIALVIYGTSFIGPFLVTSYLALCISLFIVGLATSTYAISLNSLTAIIEKEDGVFIMSGSHGFWSIGGALGAGTGSFIAARISDPRIHIISIIVIVIVAQTLLRRHYYFRLSESGKKSKVNFRHARPLIVIALVGLIFMVAEGAIADWGALYLRKLVFAPAELIGMGYAAFSVGMLLGRFTGDTLSSKLGSWRLLSYASVVSVLGFFLVLIENTPISISGFFVVGIGFSVVVPEVYRLASNVSNIKTSDGVSFLAAISNLGFLAGPVFLGFIAEWKSLHFSFIVLTVVVGFALIISTFKFFGTVR